MTDTPQHIKDLQLKIWLSKSPMERLKRTLEDNGALLQFWSLARVIDNGTSPVSKPDSTPSHIKR
jgi:hypothetical protein